MYHFIVNPNSGGEKGYTVWKEVQRYLDKKGIEYRSYITDGRGDATAIADRITADPEEDIVVVPVGGDGTMDEVLNGAHLNDKVTFGYIPTGSGNDLARSMGFPVSAVANVKRILKAEKTELLDYGVISYGDHLSQRKRYADSTGFGYDAAICAGIAAGGSRRFFSKIGAQKLAYTFIGVGEFIRSKKTHAWIVADDGERIDFDDYFFAAIQIHATEGGGYYFAPGASPMDGLLSVCIYAEPSKLKMIPMILDAKNKERKEYDTVRYITCRKIRIHTDIPLAVHTDGEVLEKQTEIEIYCEPGRLKMIV